LRLNGSPDCTGLCANWGLLATEHFGQFNLGLAPVRIGMVAASVARFIDLISANSYLFIRECTGGNVLRRLFRRNRDRLRRKLAFGFRHFDTSDFTAKGRGLQNG